MKNMNNKNKFLSSQKGSSAVILAIALTSIAAFAALAIDIGAIMMDKSKLSSAVDAAALAGMQEVISGNNNVSNIVENYMAKNISNLKSMDSQIGADNRTVTVSGVKASANYFLKVFGLSFGDIKAEASAKAENIKSLSGARPLAVVQQQFTYGKVYTLKEGGGGGTSGNYAAIALGGSGGSNYRDNLLNGYSGTISVGDKIQTETGNIAGITQTSINYLINQCNHSPECTYNYYNKNCSKILFIPVVNTLEVNGKKYVQVLGFATFFLEGVTNQAGQADVIGRFITYCMEGETSSQINDYGTYGIRLIK